MIKVYLGLALLLALLGALLWALHEHDAGIRAECKAAVAAAVASANARAQGAADDLAAWKVTHQPKTITTRKKVQDAVQADPDCSQRALPPSLHDALSAAGQSEDSRIPDGPVPAASAASP